MAVPTYLNNIAETTDTTGTGNLTLNDVAVAGSSVFPASADGKTFVYGIKDPNGVDWEDSVGVYTHSTKLLTRTLVSSSTGALINISAAGAEVGLVVEASRMQKLENMVDTSDEVAITGAITLTDTAFGKMHVCTGTTVDYTVTLPAISGNTGQMIGIRGDKALTKLVTIDGNGVETIDGITQRVIWDNEVAYLFCNGTEWVKVGGKSVPKTVLTLTRTGAGVQSISSGVWTKVDFEAGSDPYGLWNNTTNTIDNLKAGTYTFLGGMGYASGSWNAGATTRIRIVGTYAAGSNNETTGAAYTGVYDFAKAQKIDLADNDTTIQFDAYQNSGSSKTAKQNGDCLVNLIWDGGW